MIGANPLIIGPDQVRAIAILRKHASNNPMDVRDIIKTTKTPRGLVDHLKRMQRYTISLPAAFVLTFSYETGHPIGMVRHMSMSSDRKGKVPSPEAAWMVAEALGFTGSLKECQVWIEPFGRDGKAINVVQPVQMIERAGHA